MQELALSPDGSRLAYVLDGDIWLTFLGPGTSPTQLTTGPTSSRGPAFSPDGTRLAFVAERYYPPHEILVLPVDEDGPHQVDVDEPPIPPVQVLDADNLAEQILVWLP